LFLGPISQPSHHRRGGSDERAGAPPNVLRRESGELRLHSLKKDALLPAYLVVDLTGCPYTGPWLLLSPDLLPRLPHPRKRLESRARQADENWPPLVPSGVISMGWLEGGWFKVIKRGAPPSGVPSRQVLGLPHPDPAQRSAERAGAASRYIRRATSDLGWGAGGGAGRDAPGGLGGGGCGLRDHRND
jgi:hypothetical protein